MTRGEELKACPVDAAIRALRCVSAHEDHDADEQGQSRVATDVANELSSFWARLRGLWKESANPKDPEHYGKIADELDRMFAGSASRTPTEAEPGEAEVERRYAVSWLRKVARARDDRADPEWAEALSEAADFIERGEHLVHSDLPALRSTTPAPDIAEAENYTSEFVKGEAPAGVSKAVAVDEDALVERLRGVTPKYAEDVPESASARAHQAAERIEALTAENQSLQASIREAAAEVDCIVADLLDGETYKAVKTAQRLQATLAQPIGGK